MKKIKQTEDTSDPANKKQIREFNKQINYIQKTKKKKYKIEIGKTHVEKYISREI